MVTIDIIAISMVTIVYISVSVAPVTHTILLISIMFLIIL